MTSHFSIQIFNNDKTLRVALGIPLRAFGTNQLFVYNKTNYAIQDIYASSQPAGIHSLCYTYFLFKATQRGANKNIIKLCCLRGALNNIYTHTSLLCSLRPTRSKHRCIYEHQSLIEHMPRLFTQQQPTSSHLTSVVSQCSTALLRSQQFDIHLSVYSRARPFLRTRTRVNYYCRCDGCDDDDEC